MTVGIGLVGCGQWGLNYLRAFSELEGCRLVVACDPDPARLKEAQRRSPGLRTTLDVAQLLAEPEVTAVVVATPAPRHFGVAFAALPAGPDCLGDKPVTT